MPPLEPGALLVTIERVGRPTASSPALRTRACEPSWAVGRSDEAAAKAEAGRAYGTPYYISPEQIGGKPPHPRSDLFSLGILLYELLAGCSPFRGSAPGVVFDQISSGEHAPLEEHVRVPLPEIGELVEELLGEVTLGIPGVHNVSNAVGAVGPLGVPE